MTSPGDRKDVQVEQIRSALRRLNPEFHESDISWPALDALLARVESAERERDEALAALKDEMAWDMGGVPENEWKARALAAEERVKVLEEALRRIATITDQHTWSETDAEDAANLARAALSAVSGDTQREEKDA